MPIIDWYSTCGPWVHPVTLQAIAVVESGGRPLAIGTPHGAIFPRTRGEAERVLRRVLHTEPSVDIGLLQINSQWLPRLHLAPKQLLDPCMNVRVGAAILARNFVAASRPGRSHLRALVAALSAYHSGSETAALDYAAKVLSVRVSQTHRAGETYATGR